MSKYTWNAQDYAKHSAAQQKWARELIAKLSLEGTEDILDVGCGDGKVTAEIAGHVSAGSVTGMDSSGQMIALARASYPEVGYPNLFFKMMDARHLHFEQQFDVVFSNAALHWIRNHQPVLQGIFASLRPGGRILLQMGGKGNCAGVLSVLKRLLEEMAWREYFIDFKLPYGFHGADEYEHWLLETGFNDIRVELIPKTMHFNDQAGLEGWIRTTWLPYTERVPEEKRDDFIAELAAEYIKAEKCDPVGGVNVAMVRLEAEAKRVA